MLSNNYFLSLVKGRLGAYVHRLPELTDIEILRIFKKVSLFKISVYYPREIPVVVDTAKHVYQSNQFNVNGMYYVVTPNREEIINIASLHTPTLSTNGVFMNTQVLGDMINGLASGEKLTYVPVFHPPNMVEISPNPPPNWAWFMLKVNTVHIEFNTLKPGLVRSIEKVVLGDIAEFIKSTRSFFKIINSEIGSIELNVDDLDKFISEKEEEYKRFEENIHKQSNRKKVWFTGD